MEEAQIIVDVEASTLSESMHHELHTFSANANEAKNFTIFRTPHSISENKKNLFKPSVISIGPFHRGEKHLRALEQKWLFLQDFLSRGDHISLDLCISEMKFLEERTRKCYSETFDDLDSNAFVKMMLLDGCFLSEYFRKLMVGDFESILEVGWNRQFIISDLLLLENQIPFFIVEKLYELIGFDHDAKMIFVKYLTCNLLPRDCIIPAHPAETPDTIDSIIADPPTEIPDTKDSIIADPPTEIPDSTHNIDPPAEIPNSTDSTVSIDPLAEMSDPPAKIHHLVHLCYHYLVPNPGIPVVLSSKSYANRIKGLLLWFLSWVLPRRFQRRFSHSTSQRLPGALLNYSWNLTSMVIPSATELTQKGLKFAPNSNPNHMLDILFEYGVLKIPRLVITDDTKPIFANLIAFEMSNHGKKNSPFTSYVKFFDKLVNTPHDVRILQECGIVENWLGSEEELAQFINQVTEGTFIDGRSHYLAELYREVNRYIESRWNRQRAKLIRDYFSSPWAAISLIAAFILLVLTCLQSFYAVYAYKFPPSS